MHSQIRALLTKSTTSPFEYDDIDIDKLIAETDEKLWEAVCLLTRSVSERRGKSKASDPTSTSYHTKKVRRYFLLCALLFCTDDRCSLPLHTLVTEVVDSQGGSALLIKILNRLGVCTSTDTLSRFIQHKVNSLDINQNSYMNPDSFTVVSADNIDFLHSYARVFRGNQSSGWHGTSVQAVQPLPSLSLQSGIRETSFSETLHMATDTPTDHYLKDPSQLSGTSHFVTEPSLPLGSSHSMRDHTGTSHFATDPSHPTGSSHSRDLTDPSLPPGSSHSRNLTDPCLPTGSSHSRDLTDPSLPMGSSHSRDPTGTSHFATDPSLPTGSSHLRDLTDPGLPMGSSHSRDPRGTSHFVTDPGLPTGSSHLTDLTDPGLPMGSLEPGAEGEKRAPGIHCLRMRLISRHSGNPG